MYLQRCLVTTNLSFEIEFPASELQILFLKRPEVSGDLIQETQEKWKLQGANWVTLCSDFQESRSLSPAHESYSVYFYLKTQKFKSIKFIDSIGLAYFCLLSQKQGLAFAKTNLEAAYSRWPAINPITENEIIQKFFIEQSLTLLEKPNPEFREPDSNDRISVCMVTKDRPHLLCKALDSLKTQTYKNFEVILVENSLNNSLAEIDFSSYGFPIQVIASELKTPGAARNEAAKISSSKYLLFMDDDNLAIPNELESFLMAMRNTASDILTCSSQTFSEEKDLNNLEQLPYWTPLGPLTALGIQHNVFGDTNFFISRESFNKVGGFKTENFYGEDWEFLARAVLQGLTLQVVPERLFFYREHENNLSKMLGKRLGLLFRLETYSKHLPQEMSPYLQVLAIKTLEDFHRLKAEHTSGFYCGGKKLSGSDFVLRNVTYSDGENFVKLRSTTIDPQLILDDVRWLKMNKVLFLFRFYANVDFQFRVFWTNEKNEDFSEEKVKSYNFKAGHHQGQFIIESEQIIARLRIDPLESLGSIQIEKFFIENLEKISF